MGNPPFTSMSVTVGGAMRVVNYAPLDKASDDTREALTEAEWDKVKRFVLSGVNANTKRAYKAHWADFAYFCEINRLSSMPAKPETIALYLATLAEGELKRATIQARLAAITKVHDWRFAGTVTAYANPARDPLVKLSLGAAVRQRVLAREGVRQVDALSPDDIALMLDQLGDVYPGDANILKIACYRAMLLIGFAGGFRRSELVAVRLRDIKRTPNGIRITLPFSKTDQAGAGMDKFINRATDPELCPVRALDSWLSQSNIRSIGLDAWVFPGFGSRGQLRSTHLSDKMVALLAQNLAKRAGFPNWKELGGHSLRAGFITSALRQGNAEWKVRRQTGHRSSQAFRRYIRGQHDGGDAATVF